MYSNSFSASDKGIEFAKAIDEANAASGSVKVYDIAQPSDSLGQNECIICSQVTDNSGLVGLSMEAVENGTFGGETIYGPCRTAFCPPVPSVTWCLPKSLRSIRAIWIR